MTDVDSTVAHRPAGALGRRSSRTGAVAIGLIFLAASVFLGFFTAQAGRMEVMTDELLYQRMALSYGDGLSLLAQVHGETVPYYSVLYPLLIAPAMLLNDLQDGFRAAHLINAVLMASTAIPTYLIVRSAGGSRVTACLAGAASAVVPWTIFSTMLLTEVVGYPAFVWALWTIQVCLTRPSWRTDLLALLGVGLALSTRTQFAVLFGVLPLALLLHEVAWTASHGRQGRGRGIPRALIARVRPALRAHALLMTVTSIGMFVLLGLAATGDATRVFGAYQGIAGGQVFPPGLFEHARETLAVTILPIALLPMIGWTAWLLSSLLAPGDKGAHALAVTSLVAIPAMLIVASSFNLRTHGLVQERYVFYIAPLLIAGMVLFLERPRLRLVSLAAGGALTMWVMASYSDATPRLYTALGSFGQIYSDITVWAREVLGRPQLSTNQLIVAGAGAGAGALIVAGWRRARVALVVAGVVVTSFCSWYTIYVMNAYLNGHPPLHRGQDWIDRAVGSDARVATVPTAVADSRASLDVWWDAEFWNRSVQRQWLVGEAPFRPTPFPSQVVEFDRETGSIGVDDPTRITHLLLPLKKKRFGVQGEPVAQEGLLELVSAPHPLRASWLLSGTNQDGWSAPQEPVTVRLFAPRDAVRGERAVVRMTLFSDPSLTRRTYSVEGGVKRMRGSLAPGESETVSVTACVPEGGVRDLVARVPQSSLLGSSPSEVGLAFVQVDVAYGGGCTPAEGRSGRLSGARASGRAARRRG